VSPKKENYIKIKWEVATPKATTKTKSLIKGV
jgi:hypothetical protein